MSSWYIPEVAIKEIEQLRADLLRQIDFGLITTEQAKTIHWEKMRALMAQCRQETGPGTRQIPIQCDCGRVSVIASDVLRFTCVCSPHRERFPFQHRQIDLSLGITSAITM
jgi:hypothetical protein